MNHKDAGSLVVNLVFFPPSGCSPTVLTPSVSSKPLVPKKIEVDNTRDVSLGPKHTHTKHVNFCRQLKQLCFKDLRLLIKI